MLCNFPGQSEGRVADITDPDLSITRAADDVIAINCKFTIEYIGRVARMILVSQLIPLPVPYRDLQII